MKRERQTGIANNTSDLFGFFTLVLLPAGDDEGEILFGQLWMIDEFLFLEWWLTIDGLLFYGLY